MISETIMYNKGAIETENRASYWHGYAGGGYWDDEYSRGYEVGQDTAYNRLVLILKEKKEEAAKRDIRIGTPVWFLENGEEYMEGVVDQHLVSVYEAFPNGTAIKPDVDWPEPWIVRVKVKYDTGRWTGYRYPKVRLSEMDVNVVEEKS